MKETGVKAGVLDVHLPVSRNDKTSLWLEFKSETGRLSPEQKEWIAFLTEENHAVHVCRSWHEAAQITNDYLGLNLKIYPRG